MSLADKKAFSLFSKGFYFKDCYNYLLGKNT